MERNMFTYEAIDSALVIHLPKEDMNDCTVAKLDGSEGDWMMYEPFYWSKGINDYLNNKKYANFWNIPFILINSNLKIVFL